MIIRRLGWAGVEIEHRGDTIVVDLLEHRAPLGEALALNRPLPPPSVISTAGVEAALRDLGLNARAVRVWESRVAALQFFSRDYGDIRSGASQVQA